MIINCVYIAFHRGIYRAWLMGPERGDALLLTESPYLVEVQNYIGGMYADREVQYAKNVRVG